MITQGLDERLNKAFRDFIINLTGLTTIRAGQKAAPTPTDSVFATVKIVPLSSPYSAARTWREKETVDMEEISQLRMQYRADINVYSRLASVTTTYPADIIDEIQLALNGNSTIEYFQAQEIGIEDNNTPLDLSSIESEEIEYRHYIGINFNAVTERIEDLTEMKSIGVSGSVEVEGLAYDSDFIVTNPN